MARTCNDYREKNLTRFEKNLIKKNCVIAFVRSLLGTSVVYVYTTLYYTFFEKKIYISN